MTEIFKTTVDNLEKWKSYDKLQDQFRDRSIYSPSTTEFYKANKIKGKARNGRIVTVENDTQTITAVTELENRIRNKVKKYIDMFEATFHPVRIQAIKDYLLCNVDRARDLQKAGRSFLTNEKQPIVRTFVDRVTVGTYTSRYTTKVYATNEDEVEFVEGIQDFIEWAFSSSKTKKWVIDVSNDAVNLGVWFTRSKFWNLDHEQIAKAKKEWKKMNSKAVFPQLEYISPFSIYADPFRDFYEQPVIYRDILSLKDVLRKKKQYFQLTKDQISLVINSAQPVSNKNYNRVKLMKFLEKELSDIKLHPNLDDYYKVDTTDDLVEYIEYWDVDNLVIMLNGYIVYDDKNPLPTKKHPFKVVNYTRNPGTWIWDWVWTLLSGTQKLYDALFNMMFDLAKFTSWPMFKLKDWQSIEWMKNALEYKPFSFMKIQWDPNIDIFEMPKPDQINFKMMADILDLANFAISPSSYNQLQWVSRSATDSEYRFQSLRDSIRPLAESINEMFKSLINDWLIFAKHLMPNEFTVYVTWADEKQIAKYNTITKDMLAGNYIFETEFDSLKDANKSLERSQILDYLQSLQIIMTDPVDWRVLGDMEEIFKYVSSLFSKDNRFYLSEDDFYAQKKEGMEKLSELQKQMEWMQQQGQSAVQESELLLGNAAWADVASPSSNQQQVVPEQRSPVNNEAGLDTPDITEVLKKVRE